MSGAEGYAATANELVRRIEALIPEHPEVLSLASAWELFTIPGFECSDIGPSLAQASFALRDVQRRHR